MFVFCLNVLEGLITMLGFFWQFCVCLFSIYIFWLPFCVFKHFLFYFYLYLVYCNSYQLKSYLQRIKPQFVKRMTIKNLHINNSVSIKPFPYPA